MGKENWDKLSGNLHKWGLHHVTAALIEALGPLGMVGAQIMYLSEPILSTFIPAQTASDLASILEDPDKTQGFVQALRAHEPE
ncbi:MAG: hypothetical protein KGY46_03685 [Anaerolineales bacterium]|nr:hypothetical protein [Anaerolineales bacterium]